MPVLLFFIDGVGLGADDPAVNPLVAAHMPALRSLLGGRPLTRSAVPYDGGPDLCVVATDPRMDVPGLPQSATGQTAIFTGQNAAQAIGRHLNAYPTPNLRRILEAHSIFKRVEALGRRGTFLNAFRQEFFDWVAQGQPLHKDRRRRPSASTVAGLAAGVHVFRSLDQLRAGEAVGFDIDHAVMRSFGFDLDPVAPEEAGRRAAAVAGAHDFTLYEHFLTDKAGHTGDMTESIAVLERVDRFLSGLLAAMDPNLLLIITSDHGNIEDLTVTTHTYNDVPTILKGPGASLLGPQIKTLMDITPGIVRYLEHC